MKLSFSIFDNFHKNPEILRKEATKLKYLRSHLNPSNLISESSKYTKQLHQKLSSMINPKIIWDLDNSATFRVTNSSLVRQTRNHFFAHSDGYNNFGGLLYLNLPKECHGGTGFFRHKRTGLYGFHDLDQVKKSMNKLNVSFNDLVKEIEHDARKPKKWVQTDLVQMQHNRLMIYNSRIFHSHVFNFKSVDPSNVRLTLLFIGRTNRDF